ncbi:MAG: 50S ribosomal protein L6 [bacterium]|jgi:large subunit ribosomal protein L6
MSRIGNKPIVVPEGVTIDIDGTAVKVKGPKGELFREIHRDITATVEGNQIIVRRPTEEKRHKALHGLTRTLIANMVQGVTEGYAKTLELTGVGYRASLQGNKLVLALGYSKPIEVEAPAGIQFAVPNPTTVVVSGINKEQVGETSAYIRKTRDPDPYKAKGVRYAGEVIKTKAGKTGN